MLVYAKPSPHVQGGIYCIIYIRVNIFMTNGINGINGSQHSEEYRNIEIIQSVYIDFMHYILYNTI